MNYMEQVAKMLGVELGEKFKIAGKNGVLIPYSYILTEDGIKFFNPAGELMPEDCFSLTDLLCGKLIIQKKPYKPSLNEKYWAFQCTQGEVELQYLKWRDDHIDNTLYKIGDCYSTQEAAEQHRSQWEAFFADKGQVDVLGMEESKCQ